MRPEGRIMFDMKELDHFIRKQFEALMRGAGTDTQATRMQHWVVGYLYENRGRDIFQKDIEAEFRISRSTTSSMLKLMEKKGLITRESVESDARLKKLGLTKEAAEMHVSNMESMKKIDETIENSITPEEKQELMRIIAKIKAGIAAAMPTENDETEDDI